MKEEQKQHLIDMMQKDEELGLYEYIGECKGNNGNGCFMDSSGHDCGCYTRSIKKETEHLLSTKANKERLLEDVFNDEKRQGVKELIDKHKQTDEKGIPITYWGGLEEPKQERLNHIVYNIGDSIRIINPTENQPKLFTTHKVDNDFGVVYYYQLDGKEESIGFSYIKKEEPKQQTLEEASWKHNPLKKLDGEFLRHAFKEGAKWKQEQDKKCYHPLPYRLAKSDINFECTLCGKFI